MLNREIAGLLYEVADILEFQEVEWKPQAYRKAARGIEGLSGSVEDIHKKRGKKGLEDIPGVGKSIAEHIEEYLRTGRVKKWEKLRKQAPKGTHELVDIEGMGPKKVKELHDKLGISSVKDLKRAVKQHKLRDLEGFGKKTEENILESIEQHEQSKKRMLIGRAMETAEEIISRIRKQADRIDYAGSLRRWKETIGDIDILAVAKNPESMMKAFTKMPDIDRVLLKGSTKSTVILKGGVHVDLRVLSRDSYGAAMQYFTGSKDHNIALRKTAISKGYKLSEYGLYSSTNKKLAGKTEEGIYKKLGMSWIPPELRENRGEIEAAKKNRLPGLLAMKDIRGDLQMHSTYSDGDNTLLEMAEKAEKLGYDYIAITDHSKSQRIANGMSVKKLKEQWQNVEKAQKKTRIRILKGAEVDILKDGSLDYPDSILRQLDIVLGAVHSGFKAPEKEMTERVTKAFENSSISIFAHPTGRMLGKRKGYNVNTEKLFQSAKDNGIVMEINSDPERLDLNDAMIMRAKEYKLKFSIGTDAHSASGMENMRYGLGQARRAWLEKKDVINTYTLSKLKRFLGE